MDGVVAAHFGSVASFFARADLADDNFACSDGLAAKAFDAKPLTSRVAVVFTGSTCFDV